MTEKWHFTEGHISSGYCACVTKSFVTEDLVTRNIRAKFRVSIINRYREMNVLKCRNSTFRTVISQLRIAHARQKFLSRKVLTKGTYVPSYKSVPLTVAELFTFEKRPIRKQYTEYLTCALRMREKKNLWRKMLTQGTYVPSYKSVALTVLELLTFENWPIRELGRSAVIDIKDGNVTVEIFQKWRFSTFFRFSISPERVVRLGRVTPQSMRNIMLY